MNIEVELKTIEAQEAQLVFPTFDAERAWALCQNLREIALNERLPIAFDLSFGGTRLIYCSMPGATPDNEDWIRRKKNVVARFHKSSYRVALERELAGVTLEAKFGVAPSEFVASGGAFPLRLVSSPLVLGTCTVSGLPHREDHRLVVRVLANQLGVRPELVGLTSN